MIAILTTLTLISAICLFYNTFYEISYPEEKLRFVFTVSLQPAIFSFSLIILEWVLTKRTTWISIGILITLTITSAIAHLFSISLPFGIVFTLMVAYITYLLYTNWDSITKGQWAVVAALVLPVIGAFTYIYLHKYSLDLYYEYEKPINSLTVLIAPILLLVYVSVRFKEILVAISQESQKVIRITEEKKEILANQNIKLEQQVKERTAELKNSIEHLKATQDQLIQSEKMASLGELTAGIAHEIQNPLNFVNNFSELSSELIDEMNTELSSGELEEAKLIAEDIKDNLGKINFHGKRAENIVKAMLQHSRKSTAEKESTDINQLAEEYLRLAYHGLRAKDKSFNATLITDLDESVPQIKVVPQDLGRVILNLITNAFYAVNEKGQLNLPNYAPTVTVSTKNLDENIIIKVSDNGNGISDEARSKIFQPFFTTKPTGQGTGLGLSMSYDIIKSHGGSISVKTENGAYTEFTIQLPKK
ncbi:sensor histidine kinase [Portibacter marinus]|uniref:sensor histidine kinase n=1 Tax=Portibacter marinus TaxID=2898660 RepID=UPI001F449F4C|nr:ATP-binding protein [Portibacter marinus]